MVLKTISLLVTGVYAVTSIPWECISGETRSAVDEETVPSDTCDHEVKFLQTRLLLAGKDLSNKVEEVLPALLPLARSLTSEDPEAAAQHMIKYYSARRLMDTDLTKHLQTPCAEAVVVEIPRRDGINTSRLDKYTMVFVKEEKKDAGMLARGTFDQASDQAYRSMITSGNIDDGWEHMMDFHDGIWHDAPPDISNFRLDDVPIQLFGGLYKFVQDGGFRAKVPHTSWAIEVGGLQNQSFNKQDLGWLKKQQWHTEGCRKPLPEYQNVAKGNTSYDPGRVLWQKSTFAVQKSNLQEAYDFSEYVLGLIAEPAQYDIGASDECIAASWGVLPGDQAQGYEFHFVGSSPPYDDAGVQEYSHYQGKLRDLESGCFDHYLYSSLILWSDESLDPFVRRLRKLNTTFLALQLQSHVFSLVFSFPMAPAIVIDIRSSSKFHEVVPKEFDACHVTQCANERMLPRFMGFIEPMGEIYHQITSLKRLGLDTVSRFVGVVGSFMPTLTVLSWLNFTADGQVIFLDTDPLAISYGRLLVKLLSISASPASFLSAIYRRDAVGFEQTHGKISSSNQMHFLQTEVNNQIFLNVSAKLTASEQKFYRQWFVENDVSNLEGKSGGCPCPLGKNYSTNYTILPVPGTGSAEMTSVQVPAGLGDFIGDTCMSSWMYGMGVLADQISFEALKRNLALVHFEQGDILQPGSEICSKPLDSNVVVYTMDVGVGPAEISTESLASTVSAWACGQDFTLLRTLVDKASLCTHVKPYSDHGTSSLSSCSTWDSNATLLASITVGDVVDAITTPNPTKTDLWSEC